MKVQIRSEEIQKGLFSKKTYYVVYCKVEFTPDELSVIKKNDMDGLIIMERARKAGRTDGPDKGGFWNLTVFNLLKNKEDDYVLSTPAEARDYEERLKGQLKALKEHLESNAGHTPTTSSFEL